MQICPFCGEVYDESEHSHCPCCSDKLTRETKERPYKDCPDCGRIMFGDDYWECSNCGKEIYTDEDDNDGIIED